MCPADLDGGTFSMVTSLKRVFSVVSHLGYLYFGIVPLKPEQRLVLPNVQP
jgi:hypothetical protein